MIGLPSYITRSQVLAHVERNDRGTVRGAARHVAIAHGCDDLFVLNDHAIDNVLWNFTAFPFSGFEETLRQFSKYLRTMKSQAPRTVCDV